MSLTETDYISKISSLIPDEGDVPVAVMSVVEESIAEHPLSPKLWCLRGDLIQLAEKDAGYELNDALISYRRALEIDPSNAEAYESIGYYEDAITNNLAYAESSFRKAIELGAGRESHFGLARVLAELNRGTEALKILSTENCPFADTAETKEIKVEIKEGMLEN